ncbi:MAG: RimK family protein [Planctomycetota bacterium]
MHVLVIVNNATDWPFDLPERVALVEARSYITDSAFADLRGVRVFNCCRSYRYQSTGYYVSLLASARQHHPIPDLSTIHDLQQPGVMKAQVDDSMQGLLQQGLARLKTDRFTLSVYFGRNLAKRYDRLCQQLFARFPVPFLRVECRRRRHGWRIERIRIIAASEIPDEHRPFVLEAATAFFGRRVGPPRSRRRRYAYELAILVDPDDPSPPSDSDGLERIDAAARATGLRPECILPDDLPRLPTFDALFIRATTAVNHFTYRFAQRAAAEGLAVIDDPQSILRCTNKVYLDELLARHRVRRPRSVIVHKRNITTAGATLGYPCVLKQPDSGFSRGVVLARDAAQLEQLASDMLKQSDLLLAQEFLPTDYDWRIGLLDGEPLYACRYGMARDHWQIYYRDADGSVTSGWHDAVAIPDVPPAVLRSAQRAAAPIGNGLYGVDVKIVRGRPYVIEVNDNPNIDGDVEDSAAGTSLYETLMASFLRRIEGIRGR